MVNSQEKLSCQIETHGKSTQENLAQHLDSVEVNIADQVAQKSHHFFHVSFDIFPSQIFAPIGTLIVLMYYMCTTHCVDIYSKKLKKYSVLKNCSDQSRELRQFTIY